MSRRIVSLALAGYLSLIFINWSCTKLDTTTVGSDLIPAVDNISTFADTLLINSVQGAFEGPVFRDSTKLQLTDYYAVGKTADPLFGGTEANLYLQLKPGFYPYYIGLPKDTILNGGDSIVLCLSYKTAYGDTSGLLPTKLQVFEVSHDQHQEWDSLGSLRDINYAPTLESTPLSDPTTVNLSSLRTYKKIGKGNDSVINQIRIRLSDTFKSRLFGEDSLLGGAFSRDTFFRVFTNGFAIKMTEGNVLLYTQLSDAATRLELHYKRRNGGIIDTSMSTFVFNTGSGGGAAPRRSAVANNIIRTRPALPSGDQEIYLQTSPGTFASLTIPGLTGYSNRIIHRAEIILEQIPDPTSDIFFKEPSYLYYDLVDSGLVNKFKPVYFDLNPSTVYDPDNRSGLPYYPVTGEVDLNYMGAAAKRKVDFLGSRLYYTLNITRYVQKLVTQITPNYVIRVYAPHDVKYPQYGSTVYPYVNNIAAGRIRVGGGNNPEPNYRMRLRIIYSPVN